MSERISGLASTLFQATTRRLPDRATPQDSLHAFADCANHGPVANRATGRCAAPVGPPYRVCSLGELEPAAVIKVAQLKGVTTGKRVVGAQNNSDRIRPQLARADPGSVKGHPGEGGVDQSGSQPSRRIREVCFPDADLNSRVPLAKRVGQAGAGLLAAVGESPDGESGRSRS
jgi:hypothetical protein